MGKKRCTVGFPCGNTCITKRSLCRAGMGEREVRLINNYQALITRIREQAGGLLGRKEISPEIRNQGSLTDNEVSLIKSTKFNPNNLAKRGRAGFVEAIQDTKDLMQSSNYNRRMDFTQVAKGNRRKLDANVGRVSKGKNINYLASTERKKINLITMAESDKRSQELVAKHHNGVVAEVSWFVGSNVDQRTATDREKKRWALEAAKKWKKDILPNIPEGTIVMNKPTGGPLGARARGYMRLGFGVTNSDREQYAIKIGDKLEPITLGQPNDRLLGAMKGVKLDLTDERANVRTITDILGRKKR